MEEKQKRDGSYGDVWHGLFGTVPQQRILDIVNHTVQSKNPAVERYGDFATLVDSANGLSVQVTLKNTEGKLMVEGITVKFPCEFDSPCFKVDSIDEWLNGIEGTFEGALFEGHNFSFYCQNYLAHKRSNLIGKKINISMTVVARKAEVLPEKERSFKVDKGPLQGEKVFLHKMKYLNPVMDNDPEICQFFFPIQDIKIINFFGEDVYKIKGAIVDSEMEKDYFYNVFIHKSLIANPESLKIGEPFKGWGWIQAEITCVLPS